MERIAFTAHVVEVGGEAPWLSVLVGGATEHEAISVEFSAESLPDLLEDRAIPTKCGAVVCFSVFNEDGSFFRLRDSKKSVGAFLSAKLSVELMRMLRELLPREG